MYAGEERKRVKRGGKVLHSMRRRSMFAPRRYYRSMRPHDVLETEHTFFFVPCLCSRFSFSHNLYAFSIHFFSSLPFSPRCLFIFSSIVYEWHTHTYIHKNGKRLIYQKDDDAIMERAIKVFFGVSEVFPNASTLSCCEFSGMLKLHFICNFHVVLAYLRARWPSLYLCKWNEIDN